jgi:hypothetical protein
MRNRVKNIDSKSYNQALIDVWESVEIEVAGEESEDQYLLNKHLINELIMELFVRDFEGQII